MDLKITQLDNNTTIADADLIVIADDVAGTPVTEKRTWTNVKAFLKTYFDTVYAATLGADDNYVTDAEKTKLGNISITQAVDLDALETASHAALTVTDSAEIDFTLTGQDLTASLIAGSIDETKLDASTNASLDLADTALQDFTGLDTDDLTEGTTNLYSQWDAATGGINYAGGNVGIGTTNPETNLEIKSTSGASSKLRISNDGTTSGSMALQLRRNDVDAGIIALNPGGDGMHIGTTHASGDIRFFTQSDMDLATNERMIINQDGNVGIGTTNPITKLRIQNDALTGTTPLSNLVLSIASNASGAASTMNFTDATTYNGYIGMQNGNLHFGANTTSPQMTLLTTGNVGIGTTGSDRKLDILDASNPQLRLTHTDATDYADFQVDTNGNLDIQPSGSGVVKVDGVNVATVSTATDTSSATPTPTVGARINRYSLTALATNPTFAAPSGTSQKGDTLAIQTTASGATRTISYNAAYLDGITTKETSVATGETLYQVFTYNGTAWVLSGQFKV